LAHARHTLQTLRAVADLRPPPQRFRYGRSGQQLCELHLPGGAGPHPVAVVLHGGYWRAARTRRYMRPLCADLARHGWAAWNVEYRRIGRRQGGGWPATFLDVASGIDYLAGLDAGLDLGRVAAVGHSAGGHLALWAAARDRLGASAPGSRPRVRIRAAVVAIAAVSDLEANPQLSMPGEPVHELMGCAPGDAPDDRYRLANPIRLLPLGAPILLVHGEADETVPVRRSRDFAARARAAGDSVTLTTPPALTHRAVVDPRRAAWREAVRWLTARGDRAAPETVPQARP